MFNDTKWKADENKLNQELMKHSYIDFANLVTNFEDAAELLQT
jgi:hypothetical protein